MSDRGLHCLKHLPNSSQQVIFQTVHSLCYIKPRLCRTLKVLDLQCSGKCLKKKHQLRQVRRLDCTLQHLLSLRILTLDARLRDQIWVLTNIWLGGPVNNWRSWADPEWTCWWVRRNCLAHRCWNNIILPVHFWHKLAPDFGDISLPRARRIHVSVLVA